MQYKLHDFTFEKLKSIVNSLTMIINYIIYHIKNYNSDKNLNSGINIYENISEHLNIFNLLNEVYYHKYNNLEADYTSLKREIKVLADIIKQVNNSLVKSKNQELKLNEFDDIRKRLDAFRNINEKDDLIYETINL
jgi:hypothetical protein